MKRMTQRSMNTETAEVIIVLPPVESWTIVLEHGGQGIITAN